MTTAAEGEELTRVGPGTPMGALMRQYWLPAAKSSELIAGGDPVRLMLLGERLVAFRGPDGQVGVLDQRCPHRCASLFFGRNETGGIRCVYHGWKFAADGTCMDMPNLPPGHDFRDKVRAKAYPVTERAGVVWVYMGERSEAPPMPQIEATLLPEASVSLNFTQRECNWLQALEGDIDTSHFSWLHVGSVQPEQVDPDNWLHFQVTNRAPDYHVADTDWGTMYCAYRPADGEAVYWRFAHFAFPFWTFIPQGDMRDRVIARAWVPMDDTHTMFVGFTWAQASRTATLSGGRPIPGATPAPEYIPNSTAWFGRWRPVQNEANDYLIDRAAQRTNLTYTGITHIAMQDQAITESMGAIVDHTWEHLAPSDQMITRTRRRLLIAARAWQNKQTVPPCVDAPGVFSKVRSGECVLAADDWQAAYATQLRLAKHPQELQAAAE